MDPPTPSSAGVSPLSPPPPPHTPIATIERKLSISGLEVVFSPPAIDHNPSSGPEAIAHVDNNPSSAPEVNPEQGDREGLIPVANQDPQDPESAPQVISQEGQSEKNALNMGANPNGDAQENSHQSIEPDLPAYSSPTRGPERQGNGGGGAPSPGNPEAERVETDWNTGLFNCFGAFDLCSEACFCPCILAGRTHTRLTRKNAADDHLSSSNGYCLNCCVLLIPSIIGLPLWWVPMSASRRELRFKYGIKGSHYGDCCASMWLPCCVLVQEEREVVGREKLRRQLSNGGNSAWGGQSTEGGNAGEGVVGYTRPQEMTYQSQSGLDY